MPCIATFDLCTAGHVAWDDNRPPFSIEPSRVLVSKDTHLANQSLSPEIVVTVLDHPLPFFISYQIVEMN